MQSYLVVGLGGFLGAISRFWVTQAIRAYTNSLFPISTLIINVSGCLLIGVLSERLRGSPSTEALFFIVGFLGAFTTFSAFGLETIELIRNNSISMAFINILGSLLFCLMAVIIGGKIGSFLR